MKDTDYAYCVARLRALESRLFSDSFLQKLAEASDLKEALRLLKDSGGPDLKNEEQDYFSLETAQLWKDIYESVPDKKETEILCFLNDYFNLKALVKCRITGDRAENFVLFPTSLRIEKLTKADTEHFFELLPEGKRVAAAKAYEASVKTESGQLCDIIVDVAATDFALAYSKAHKNTVEGEICAFICDSSNMKAAIRCARLQKDKSFAENAVGSCFYLDREKMVSLSQKGEKELFDYLFTTVFKEGAKRYLESSSAYDFWCDERIIEIAAKSKLTAFGFSPVCCYYYKKLSQIKKISSILTYLKKGMDSKTIKERVWGKNV